MKDMLERNQATLVGAAYGDSWGMVVEGWHRDQIKRHVGVIDKLIDPVIIRDGMGNVIHKDENGSIPYISPFLQRGNITDGVWMTIACARSIAEVGGLDLDNLAKHSLEIYQQQVRRQIEITPDGTPIASFLHPGYEIPQPFGGTTTLAHENLAKGIPPTQSGVSSRNPGNGPTERVSPIALYMHATGRYDEGLEFAEQAGKMTHLDPRSVVSGVVQSHAIYSLLSGVNRQEFIDSTVDVCQKWEKSKEQGKEVSLLERLKWMSDNRDTNEEDAYKTLGVGWPVTRNYPMSIFMFQKNWDSLLPGMQKLINFGGDCDSTGAMYGALAGAKDGMIFPKGSINMLENIKELFRLSEKIYFLGNK